MFIHKPSHSNPPTTSGASSRGSLRQRLALALQVLVHGEGEPQGARRPLDPRIVAGIDRHADYIADAFDDQLAGSFARDILTESAYLIVDSFGEPHKEAMRETAESEATADLLSHGRGEPT